MSGSCSALSHREQLQQTWQDALNEIGVYTYFRNQQRQCPYVLSMPGTQMDTLTEAVRGEACTWVVKPFVVLGLSLEFEVLGVSVGLARDIVRALRCQPFRRAEAFKGRPSESYDALEHCQS